MGGRGIVSSSSSIPALETLSRMVASLRWHAERFQIALDLFDHLAVGFPAEPPAEKAALQSWIRRSNWRLIAAKDAALQAYHFRAAIKAIDQLLPTLPSIGAGLDRQRLKLARQLFDRSVPGWEFIRHAIAHEVDFMATPQEFEKHAAKLAVNENPSLVFGLVGRKFLAVAQDKENTIEISAATKSVLDVVADEILASLVDALKPPILGD